jgi:hypothetical protein
LELLEKTLSYLDNVDKQSAKAVSRSWNMTLVNCARHEEYFRIRDLARLLGKNLQESHASQKKDLFYIEGDDSILKSITLSEVYLSLNKLKGEIIKVLTKLDKNSLENLLIFEGEHVLFKNIIQLALIYKQLDEARTQVDEARTQECISKISKALAKHGDIGKATEAANMILDEIKRGFVLGHIHEEFSIDRAIRVANRIPDFAYHKREIAFGSIVSRILKNTGSYDKVKFRDEALHVANGIPNDKEGHAIKMHIFKVITEVLAESGEIDAAVRVVSSISDRSKRCEVIGNISKLLMKKNDVGNARIIANMISDDEKIQIISNKLLGEDNDVEGAIDIADISDEDKRGFALGNISQLLKTVMM